MFFPETDLSDFIEENDVKFIRMTFCDTFGNMKNIAIMPRELHRAITDGIPFNATGLLEASHQNLLLKPDTSTLSILPWRPQSGRVVMCFFQETYLHGRHSYPGRSSPQSAGNHEVPPESGLSV